ncbi:sensor histidine kinase [Paenibacillus macerans]|uniref:sensor histidine kinase n=1 Tax=Paenibacillus macerans TaxID=44252 RepID=UPI00203C4445|nr:sensor histidine kinase [Paenibacillus macerans]MCM3701604.1 sensor histidine kinase [Paenibacillus macerans]
MKKIWFCFVNFYKNAKLNVKLLITITLIMVATLVLVLGGLQYAFSLYDEQIYAKSSQVLMMSSNSIEEELERVEEVSYNIVVDPYIQKILLDLQANVDGYEFYRLEQKMGDALEKYVDPENYIAAIYLYDSAGREFLAGDSSNPLQQQDKELAFSQADQYEGKNYWLELAGYNGDLISVRLIRSYGNLNFENIGKLLVRVNLNRIVSDLPKPHGEIAGNIVITKGDEVFYSEKGMDDLKEYHFKAKNAQGYSIEDIHGERTFVNHITTDFKDWTYWSLIPFNMMFSKITAAKYTLVLVFMFMFVFLISLGFNFLRKIHRIDELIQENYSKQLLIKETEFKALQAQINPHFLYNTLESVNWLAKINQQEQISSMVEALGHLMRYSTNFNQDFIIFEDEIEIVNSYLTIQKYRFDDRIDFQMDIPGYVKKYKIPKLILQPLLENSFKHAVEPSVDLSVIKLQAYQEEDRLFIRIEDNGPGIDPLILQKVKEGQVNPKGTGIGLNNIDDRIKLYAGEHYGLSIENLSGKGTAITVVLPVQTG